MAEFPALPIFTDAFISDTTHLTAAQTGSYLMLLFIAWRTKENGLPDDDAKLASWARMGRKAWDTQKSIIMSFWSIREDGLWHQSRLDDERKRANDVRDRNSKAGTASSLKRKERHSTSVDLGCNGTSTPSPSPSPTKKESPIPPLFEEFWNSYPKERRDSKNKTLPAYLKALTKTTEDKIYAAVIRYASSDEACREGGKFAKGTIAWLNAERWTHDYKPYGQTAQANGKRTYGDSLEIAAAVAGRVLDEKEDLWPQGN